MAGVINEWRTSRQGWSEPGAFTYPTENIYVLAEQDPVDSDGWNKQYAGAAGSRATAKPSMNVWFLVFNADDFGMIEEDWTFLADNITKLTAAIQLSPVEALNFLVKELLSEDSGKVGDTFQKVLLKDKKLPPYMNAVFKVLLNNSDVYNKLSNENKGKIDLIAFQLLMVGKIEDVLQDAIITKGNGFAQFITKINQKADEYLKRGVRLPKYPQWNQDTGKFEKQTTKDTTENYVSWLTATQNAFGDAYDWATAPDAGKFLENTNVLYEKIIDNLKPGYKDLDLPLNVGTRASTKITEIYSNGVSESMGYQFIGWKGIPKDIIYNGKTIAQKDDKLLTKDNIKDTAVLEKLNSLIGPSTEQNSNGGTAAGKTVQVPNGINNTNLYAWAQSEEAGAFTPDFSNSSLFKPDPNNADQIRFSSVQQLQFYIDFNYFLDYKKLKQLILLSYQSAWYGFISWFIEHKRKISAGSVAQDKKFDQVTTINAITSQVGERVAIIIGLVYTQYLYAQIWMEAQVLLWSDDEEISLDELDSAIKNAQDSSAKAISSAFQGGGLEQADELSEEDISERQKFIKQCVLMYNLEGLKNNYRSYIKSKINIDLMHKSGPFNYRFHALNNSSPDDSSNSIVTRLQMPPQKLMEPFLEITPDIQAFLVPKIRLFRINSSIDGLKETEFVFDKIEDKKRIDELLSAQFDRGNSYGIKSFDFSFEGSNPATSRNDITANLSLYFQSFQELITTRNHGQGEYRIIDLLVFPVNPKNRQGTKTIRAEEYDPSYYRIRADVGWAVPESSTELTKALTNRGFTYDGLKNAILSTNKSFYLNAVDHEMDLKDDGSVEMKINYRAYAENALKTSKYDVMSTATLRKNRQKFKEAMAVAIQGGNCSEEEISTLKDLFQIAEEEMLKQTYRSILKRLNEKQKIFFVDVNIEDIKKFRKDGYFSSKSPPRLLGVNGSGAVVQQGTVEDKSTEEEAAKAEANDAPATMALLKDGVKDYSAENLREDNRINFFYLGDLIYTAMDSLYETDGSLRKDIEKTVFLLGSFDSADAFGSNSVKEYNIMDLPVSVSYFYEWFTQNVIKTKKLSYPIMDFVRDLTNDLVIKLLFDNCGRKPIDTKMRFNTATFLAVGKGTNNNIDSFKEYSKAQGNANYPVIDVSKYYGQPGGLPFLTDREGNANINNFFNYILIYPVKTSAIYGGVGNFFVDGARGVHHFNLGKNKGLIKKIKFSKTDMNYIREARFFRNGFDGLQQLSAVYKTSIEMFGNTMYYPGMELYIDAVGIGGPNFRSNVEGSLAHILGFGGYHLITRVNINISPGKFSTTVEAQWFHSGVAGDRSLGPERNKNTETKEPDENIEKAPAKKQVGMDEFTTKCSPLIVSLESYVESVRTDPLAENEFNPDLSSFPTETGGTSSNDAIQTTDTTEYSDGSVSNINEVPDTGEN